MLTSSNCNLFSIPAGIVHAYDVPVRWTFSHYFLNIYFLHCSRGSLAESDEFPDSGGINLFATLYRRSPSCGRHADNQSPRSLIWHKRLIRDWIFKQVERRVINVHVILNKFLTVSIILIQMRSSFLSRGAFALLMRWALCHSHARIHLLLLKKKLKKMSNQPLLGPI